MTQAAGGSAVTIAAGLITAALLFAAACGLIRDRRACKRKWKVDRIVDAFNAEIDAALESADFDLWEAEL